MTLPVRSETVKAIAGHLGSGIGTGLGTGLGAHPPGGEKGRRVVGVPKSKSKVKGAGLGVGVG